MIPNHVKMKDKLKMIIWVPFQNIDYQQGKNKSVTAF
jgi:hypothetical protein